MHQGLGEAIIEVRASIARLDRDLSGARRLTERATNDMQRSADRANARLSRMGSGVNRSMTDATRGMQRFNGELRQSDRLASQLIATIGGVAATRYIIGLADQYTSLSARIRLVVAEGENFADVQEGIFQAAQRSRAPIADLTNLYVRLRQSMADLGDAEALNISETLARTLTISGAGPSETSAFLRQISQALASGVLRGDEFNSVMENNARFARLLADHLGVGVGELRKMAEEGKLTADVIRGALAGGAAQVNREFDQMPLTVGAAVIQIQNAVARYVGETDQGLGASRRLAEGLSLLARNFQTVADAAILLGGAFGVAFLGRGAQAAFRMAGREVRRWDAPYRTERFGMQRQRSEAADVVARDADDRARRERLIEQRRHLLELRRARVEYLRRMEDQRNAARMFPSDGQRINDALRSGRAPILRDSASMAGPMAIPGASGRTAAQEMERAQRKAIEAEKALQAARAESYRQSIVSLQAYNRLKWVTGELSAQQGILAQAMRSVQAAGVGVSRFFGSLFNFLGGPWGAALAVATVAFIAFRSEQEKAAQQAARLESALSIVASITPAFEGAADVMGEVASETSTIADLSEEAAKATDKLADAQSRAAGMARDQAEATAALTEIRRRDAIETMRQTLAEERKRLHTLENYTAGERVADFFTGDFIGDRAGRRDPGREAIETSRASVAILERGIAALDSGLGVLGGNGGGGNGGGTPGGPSQLTEMRIQAQLSLARLRNQYELVAELEDALSIEQRTTAYIQAGLKADRARATAAGEVRAEREALIAQQQESLRLSGLQERIDILREQENHRLADTLEDQYEIEQRYRQLRAEGAGEQEAIDRARQYVQAQREAAEAARLRAEAEAALDFAYEIAGAEGHNRRSREAERAREIAQREGDYRGRGYGEASRGMATRDVDAMQAATARGELRNAFDSALFAAATGGSWREAMADSLRKAAEEGFSRVMDYLYDALFSTTQRALSNAASNSGSGSNFFGQVLGFLFGVPSTGGKTTKTGTGSSAGAGVASATPRANGGSIEPFKLYKGAEIGTEPVFLTNRPGQVITNRAMRDAMSQNTGGAVVKLEVDAKTDGSVDLRIASAKQQAIVEGASAAVKMVGRAQTQSRSK